MTELPPTVERAALGPATPLGAGGIGAVEALEGTDRVPLVLKRFHDPSVVDVAVLDRLVAWRRELGAAERRSLDRIAAWPLATVTDDGRVVGYAMQRAPHAMTQSVRVPSGTWRVALREAQYLFAPAPKTRRLGLPAISSRMRLDLVRALARALAFLHERRVVVGDLSARNIVWSAGGEILLVDCDSFTLGGCGSPLPATFTVDWDDPAQPLAHAASADVYKLGLFAVRALARSFQARDPELAAGAIDPTGLLLVRRSLAADPSARPPAQAWERWACARSSPRPRSKEHIHDA